MKREKKRKRGKKRETDTYSFYIFETSPPPALPNLTYKNTKGIRTHSIATSSLRSSSISSSDMIIIITHL